MDQLLLVMEDEDGSTMKQAIYNQVVPEPCNVSAVGCRKAAVHHSLNRSLHYSDFIDGLQANPRRPETPSELLKRAMEGLDIIKNRYTRAAIYFVSEPIS